MALVEPDGKRLRREESGENGAGQALMRHASGVRFIGLGSARDSSVFNRNYVFVSNRRKVNSSQLNNGVWLQSDGGERPINTGRRYVWTEGRTRGFDRTHDYVLTELDFRHLVNVWFLVNVCGVQFKQFLTLRGRTADCTMRFTRQLHDARNNYPFARFVQLICRKFIKGPLSPMLVPQITQSHIMLVTLNRLLDAIPPTGYDVDGTVNDCLKQFIGTQYAVALYNEFLCF